MTVLPKVQVHGTGKWKWYPLEIVEGSGVEEKSSEEKSRNSSNDGIYCARHLRWMTLLVLILINFDLSFCCYLSLINFEHMWYLISNFGCFWLLLIDFNLFWFFWLVVCVLSTLSLSWVGSKPAMMLQRGRSVLMKAIYYYSGRSTSNTQGEVLLAPEETRCEVVGRDWEKSHCQLDPVSPPSTPS